MNASTSAEEENRLGNHLIPEEDDTDLLEEKDVANSNSNVGEEIARQEGKAVFWLRMLVVAVLAASAVAVVVSVYFYAANEQQEAFESKFDGDALKVLDAVSTTLEQTLGSTDAFIAQMVSYARYSNSSWPFVTVPSVRNKQTVISSVTKCENNCM